MDGARWSLLVLLAVTASVSSLHRGTRQAIKFAVLETRLRVWGASGEDFYRLAERALHEGGGREIVERLCRRAQNLKPDDGIRAFLLMLKAEFHPDIVREMDAALVTGDELLGAGDFENAKREYWHVLERDLNYSTQETAKRAERARIGLARLPPVPWTFR